MLLRRLLGVEQKIPHASEQDRPTKSIAAPGQSSQIPRMEEHLGAEGIRDGKKFCHTKMLGDTFACWQLSSCTVTRNVLNTAKAGLLRNRSIDRNHIGS